MVSNDFLSARDFAMSKYGAANMSEWFYVAATDLLYERGTEKDGWKFQDGSNIPVSSWSRPPDNYLGSQDCVEWWKEHDSLNDIPCSTTDHADLICQWKPTSNCINKTVLFEGNSGIAVAELKNSDLDSGFFDTFEHIELADCAEL